jgi:hypothetical protein
MNQKERMGKIRQIAGWLEHTTQFFHNAVMGTGPADHTELGELLL